MAFLSITSQNADFILTVPGVYPGGVKLQGFGVDEAFLTEAVDVTEEQVGVDNFAAAGLVSYSVPMTIRFLASADANFSVFENWNAYMRLTGDVAYASAVISMPSVRRKYTCGMGNLRRFTPMAEARKVLGNREYRIIWLPQGQIEPISAAPM